ncbi:MAG: hypothetical protein ACI9F2_000437 [Lysobacterales bacterium]|jgi:hypothetical protein
MPNSSRKPLFYALTLAGLLLLCLYSFIQYDTFKKEYVSLQRLDSVGHHYEEGKHNEPTIKGRKGVDSKEVIDINNEEDIFLKSIVDVAMDVYTESQISKREGYLWVDRKTSQYIITLGAMNGLLSGSKLSVFHNDRFIGEVEVDVVFDSISYVVSKPDIVFEEGDYYKVVAKDK